MLGGFSETIQALPVWIQIPLILLGAIVGAKLIEVGGYYVLHRSGRLASGQYDRLILEEVHLPLYVTVFLAGVYVSSRLLPELALGFYVATVSISVILVTWARAITRLGNRVISLTNDAPTRRDIAPIFKNVLTFVVVLATVVALLSVWQVDVTPLLASAGILGIIIGIAAQDSLGNFFGGLSLYFDRTYKLGDMVELESGERGTVIDMSIRSTTVLTRDNIAITVPNASMNSTQVINESAPVRRRRIRLDVGVAYGSDLETVEREIIGAADDEAIVLDSPKPQVRFREFADSAVVAQLQCHIAHPAQRGQARDVLIRQVDRRFDDEDIKIPFPQREVTFFESENRIAVESERLERDPQRDDDSALGVGTGEP